MNFLKKMFPFISAAAAAGGPLGSLAAAAVGKALGLDKVDPTPEGIASAFQSAGGTPEQLAGMQKAEQDFQVQMASLGFASVKDLAQISEQDRDSARNREIQTKDSWTPRLIAGFVVLGWMAVQWFLLQHIIAAEMRDIIMRSMGTLDMALGLVLGYYFGSSAGSANKDDTIQKMAK